MNEVYVSGRIVKLQRCSMFCDVEHFRFLLQVTYRDPMNQVAVENFVVDAWNEVAKWAEQNLHTGDDVVVKGAITHMRVADKGKMVVSAKRIIITQRSRTQVLKNEQ